MSLIVAVFQILELFYVRTDIDLSPGLGLQQLRENESLTPLALRETPRQS